MIVVSKKSMSESDQRIRTRGTMILLIKKSTSESD
jgi:hypothetical protein